MSSTILKFLVIISLFLFSCKEKSNPQTEHDQNPTIEETSLIILGTVQDAGAPHIACSKDCCRGLFKNPDPDKKVVSLGVIDPQNKKSYIFEATPDFPEQMKMLKNLSTFSTKETPDGIFLTHAHIGHYTGLMYLGREAMNANDVPVYAMPKMKSFLEHNGPWSQLVNIKNISIHEIQNRKEISLTPNLNVVPFLVPHRDEYSETAGFKISGPNKKALFIPDIDKWEKWDSEIIAEIAKVDYAFLDASFFDGEEINNRDISEIPHPFIIESMNKFENLSAREKSKIYFIHFNHTNPVLNLKSTQAKQVISNGFNIAKINDIFGL
ncbi:MAG: MBL fold metallo-hydrolase [Calditrichaeota bacterium]|nr:MAG: pyrroloquinoline quinone biosynthesis protein PqqB [Calditrichota bacterium]MBL1206471.1 MBL fold metallo-hydrolase [Calditrichota bacterium]NOG46298.1 MBL fold metallo-hydrolase [Calditrichota bacterium]